MSGISGHKGAYIAPGKFKGYVKDLRVAGKEKHSRRDEEKSRARKDKITTNGMARKTVKIM